MHINIYNDVEVQHVFLFFCLLGCSWIVKLIITDIIIIIIITNYRTNLIIFVML